MDLNDYQRKALETYVVDEEQRVYGPLLLTAEAGEVANIAHKLMRGDFENAPIATLLGVRERVRDELGDTLYALAITADAWGLTLDDVAAENYRKLKERREAGTIKGGLR